jgi:hypothetical protein
MTPRTPLPADATERLSYLSAVGSLLWPEPARFEVGSGDRSGSRAGREEYLLVPGPRKPRLLVPAGRSRRAAASAVRHYGEQLSAKARVQAAALSAAARTGALSVAASHRVRITVPAGAETITGYLSRVLDRPVSLSMHIGPARANRKPVLQLLDARGRTMAYAKVGIDPLTRRLVHEEGRTLRTLAGAGLGRLRLPEVLYSGMWRGLEVLVLSALPVWHARREDPARLADAMVELATTTAIEEGRLVASSYRRLLTDRMAAMPETSRSDAVREAAGRLDERVDAEVLRYGAWHGDWTAWNCACLADTVLLWDWERYARPVPLGFDALHYWMQGVMQRRSMPLPAAATACLAQAPAMVAPFGLAPGQAVATARLYLLDLAVRYCADRQDASRGQAGVVEDWLLPALTG